MPRFYIDPPAGDFVTLTGEDARHICRSLRMAVGEALTLCDGAGIDYNGVLRQTDGQIATVEILSRQPSQTEPTRLDSSVPGSAQRRQNGMDYPKSGGTGDK